MRPLAELVSAAEPFALEQEIFDTTDAAAIAEAFAGFVETHLGGALRGALGYATSSACVASLVLDDGRPVVVKAHRPRVSEARLSACQEIQRRMRGRGIPAPSVLLEPRPLGAGLGTVETHLGAGSEPDAREPAGRARIAATLARVVHALDPDELERPPGASWFGGLPPDRLWPRTHSPLFDFESTNAGAGWIDELARRARAVPPAGRRVVGHFDWRAEHLRFAGNRAVAVYDWEAVHIDAEPIVVGSAAHAFSARSDGSSPPPTLEEARAFVSAYEEARRAAFEPDERRCLGAAWVYATAYSARCTHALSAKEPFSRRSEQSGGFLEVLAAAGEAVLARGW